MSLINLAQHKVWTLCSILVLTVAAVVRVTLWTPPIPPRSPTITSVVVVKGPVALTIRPARKPSIAMALFTWAANALVLLPSHPRKWARKNMFVIPAKVLRSLALRDWLRVKVETESSSNVVRNAPPTRCPPP